MPNFVPFTRNQLPIALDMVRAAVYPVIADLEITAWHSKEPLPYHQRTSGKELKLKIGDSWGELFDCAWFRFSGVVPHSAAGQPVVALLDVNGEMCVYDDQGVPLRGLTNVTSEFARFLGLPGKNVLPLLNPAQGGEPVEIWADAGANDLFGVLQENGAIRQAHLALLHSEIKALYYDFEVLYDSLSVLPESSARFQQILEALNRAIHRFWNGVTEETARAAREELAPVLAQKGGDPSLQISARGHAHIDLGWLWPIRETKRKGARTFATALRNMESYPDYVFSASQAQLFQWMKEEYPALYAQVKERVKQGQLEPQGALWVECDTNLTCGESLIRQILYGRRFFREEFDVDPDYVWLPDTFGYSAALPQIMAKSGIRYFSTQKLSWSLLNRFPYQSFHWQGIDGSEVLVHCLPEENYNSPAAPRSLHQIETNYSERGVSHHAMLVYGIGDGGGGPGEEHLERLARLRNFAGLSPVKQEWTSEFFPKWAAEAPRFPTWVGELYLERHQGTLTTNARNKWFNRKIEQALRELEWVAAIAAQAGLASYPSERLEAIWKEVLLYQFHDILPGSSIKRVYDESLARYRVLLDEVEALLLERQQAIAALLESRHMQLPVAVFNSLAWERREWLHAEGHWHQVTVPGLSAAIFDYAAEYTVSPEPVASDRLLENELVRVTFAEDGSITSLFDKRLQRDAIAPGETANQLVVYKDYGDAWDFPMDYAESQPLRLQLVSATAQVNGPQAVLEQVYRLGYSELVLRISLLAGSPRLDFDARLRWRETQTMLRALFPANVFAESATFEVQFGHIQRPTHRNTTWDLARDEVPAQKWVDLSQQDFGLALLNDCKYGHQVKGHTISLNLLRSVPYPGPRLVEDAQVQPGEAHPAYTDQAEHAFRYALYPHGGDAVSGGVVREAYAFNDPLRAVPTGVHSGRSGTGLPWVWVKGDGIVVETLKQAEDASGIIVRVYQSARAEAKGELSFAAPVTEVWETNLLEKPLHRLAMEGGKAHFYLKPFEIKTFLCKSA